MTVYLQSCIYSGYTIFHAHISLNACKAEARFGATCLRSPDSCHALGPSPANEGPSVWQDQREVPGQKTLCRLDLFEHPAHHIDLQKCLSITLVCVQGAQILMTDWNTVLFKLKPGVNKERIENFVVTAKSMVGKIPGTCCFYNHDETLTHADRSSGFSGGAWACLDRPQGQGLRHGFSRYLGEGRRHHILRIAPCTPRVRSPLSRFGGPSDSRRTHRLREELCDDTLAFDFEY